MASAVNVLEQNQGSPRDNYVNRRDRTNNSATIVCYFCNRYGQTKRFCRQLQHANLNSTTFSAQRGGL